MGVKAYSLADKQKKTIKSGIKLTKYALPNGNVVSIICGKTKKLDIVCTIVTNEKPKPCKSGKRTVKGARCKRTVKK